jgi:hypothetical protein
MPRTFVGALKASLRQPKHATKPARMVSKNTATP